MAFLGSCVGCQAQVSNQESFSAGGLYFEPTSDTTAKVVRPEMRRPNKPIPIMYYYDEYNIPASVKGPDGKDLSVTSIDEQAFCIDRGEGSFRVVLPPTMKEIGKAAFFGTPVAEVVLNNGLEVIGEEAFAHSELKSLTIPGNVRSIGDGILKECKIEELTIKEGIKQLPAEMCIRAKALRSVALPASITEIGESAFRECSSLEVFNWPAKLKNIETYAFFESGLNNGNLPEGLLTIGDMAFWKTNFTTVTIPASLTSFGDAAFYSTTLEAFEASAASKQYSSHEGLLMDKAKKMKLV